MFTRNTWLRLVLVFLCFAARPGAAQGRFELLKTYMKFPEMQPVASFTLVTDEHQITFLPPRDSTVQLRNGEVEFTFKDDHCIFKLRLSTNSPALASPEAWDELRGRVAERFFGADISPATLLNTGGLPGCSFLINEKTAYNTKLKTQLACVPFQGGMLEFCLTSATDKGFDGEKMAFSRFVQSLRVERPDRRTLTLRDQ